MFTPRKKFRCFTDYSFGFRNDDISINGISATCKNGDNLSEHYKATILLLEKKFGPLEKDEDKDKKVTPGFGAEYIWTCTLKKDGACFKLFFYHGPNTSSLNLSLTDTRIHVSDEDMDAL